MSADRPPDARGAHFPQGQSEPLVQPPPMAPGCPACRSAASPRAGRSLQAEPPLRESHTYRCQAAQRTHPSTMPATRRSRRLCFAACFCCLRRAGSAGAAAGAGAGGSVAARWLLTAAMGSAANCGCANTWPRARYAFPPVGQACDERDMQIMSLLSALHVATARPATCLTATAVTSGPDTPPTKGNFCQWQFVRSIQGSRHDAHA